MNPFVIYGAGCQGVALLRLLAQSPSSPSVHCFIDSHPAKQGQTLDGCPVYAPDYLLELREKDPRVAVAAGGHYSVIRRLLEKLGFEENTHFYDATPRPLKYGETIPEFSELHDQVRRHTLLSEDRLGILYQLACQANHVPGDAVEVGVYKGGTALLMATALKNSTQQIHLFDTFCGMPAAKPDVDLHRAGDFSDTTAESVSSLLQNFNNIHLHPGLFPDSLPRDWHNHRFSLVHIDVDIFSSTLACCRYFYPRLNPGGVMVIDDYGFPSCPGVRKAVDEYFNNCDQRPLYLPTGQALIYQCQPNACNCHKP
ncbi:hypothetical protein A7E78_09375 [Syntrophotalea acetylenivorans]|uniref:Macrocin O-methyltransferase n=1 Tax=Syntrophotalea acetylenivorans TaxID=1842532 RepID=A0A1L3GQ21_9BACT|nr:TylF/MycF/NovP-related O-methyltransferase [Syntrophotalea acetylenivorans]APG28027.1 hypothetical protein A7E78_09375 [Syntrophotalea acetylenivorans]